MQVDRIWLVAGQGYFWPGWVLFVWGVVIVLDVWNGYFRGPVNESDDDRETNRLR